MTSCSVEDIEDFLLAGVSNSQGGSAQVTVPVGPGEAKGVAGPRRLHVHLGAGTAAGHQGGGWGRGQPAAAPGDGADGLEAEA